jgi:hypothetical protein
MIRSLLLGMAAAIALGGCGEKAQTASASTKKVDGKPWEATASANMAPDWKGGDQAAWEEQMRARAQSQNEYLRAK